MRDQETFEARLASAYRRYADEVTADVDPMVLARTIVARPDGVPLHRPTVITRFQTMNATLKIAAVAVLALAVGIGVVQLRPSTNIGGSDPSSSPAPEPAPLRNGSLPAGSYVTTPFAQPGSDACFTPPEAGCIDPTDDDAIRITFTVPEGWEGSSPEGIRRGEAALILERGASLAADPCHNDGTGDIPVGPSVSNFVSALEGHPLLSVTDPIEVTLGGHPGTYVQLQVPDDPSIQGSSQPASQEGCPVYRPWDPWYLAQGPGERWHLWIVDVDGVRVVVHAIDHESTSADVKAQLEGIVDSVRIERPVESPASPSPASLTWSPASLEQDWPAPVRAEPSETPVLVPAQEGTDGSRYIDPTGDIGPSAPQWIDISKVEPTQNWRVIYVRLGETSPSPAEGPSEQWIAYGLVVDTDGDGVADLRYGIDNLPPGGGHRAWRTDLRTGRTESAVGAPYGKSATSTSTPSSPASGMIRSSRGSASPGGSAASTPGPR